jgi:hypothetical protein
MTSRTFGLLLLVLCAAPPARACLDPSKLGLSDTIAVTSCRVGTAGCLPGNEAVHRYMAAQEDDESLFTIGLQSSPWRAYDGELRILTVEEIAAVVRAQRDAKIRKVVLLGNWTGRSPEAGVPSLAARLSTALDGFPVSGQDGFLWIDPKGRTRTTHQAFTGWFNTGSYGVPEGGEVMVAMVVGWASLNETLMQDDPEFLLYAATGHDVFGLCPEKALAGFEAAAAKGSAIGAYNAALMRLERNGPGDAAAARKLLGHAVALGDEKARARLAALPPR